MIEEGLTVRMAPFLRFLLFGTASVVLLLVGCAAFQNRSTLRTDETNLQVIGEAIEKKNAQVRTLSGRAQLVIESPQQSFSGSAVVHFKNPDSIYVRVEAVLGLDVAVIQADRKRFVIFSPMENLAYVGASADTLRLQPFLGFDMTFDQMLHSMSGLVQLETLENPAVRFVDDDLVITGQAHQVQYEYHVDPQFGAVSRLVMRDNNQKILRIEEYKRFIRQGNARVPQMVRFIRPTEKESLTLFYNQLDINKALSPKHFYVKMPAGVLKVRL
jgi:outer membrane biogenesis lipoprotein LolB